MIRIEDSVVTVAPDVTVRITNASGMPSLPSRELPDEVAEQIALALLVATQLAITTSTLPTHIPGRSDTDLIVYRLRSGATRTPSPTITFSTPFAARLPGGSAETTLPRPSLSAKAPGVAAPVRVRPPLRINPS